MDQLMILLMLMLMLVLLLVLLLPSETYLGTGPRTILHLVLSLILSLARRYDLGTTVSVRLGRSVGGFMRSLAVAVVA